MDNDNASIGFFLQGIKTEQFAVSEENYTQEKETELGFGLQFKLSLENQQIGVFVDFKLMQRERVFLKIQVSCHFKIEEHFWTRFIQNNKLVVPKGLSTHLAMIATGTARGVLFAKTEAMPFSGFIIPTLNIAEIIREDVSFDVEAEQPL
jgi:hypothetical protein